MYLKSIIAIASPDWGRTKGRGKLCERVSKSETNDKIRNGRGENAARRNVWLSSFASLVTVFSATLPVKKDEEERRKERERVG